MKEKYMWKIYVDSSERNNKSVKLLQDNNVVDELIGDINIPYSIQQLLHKNKLDIKDINEFVPNLGPGSFTGLKIGVTVCNILNWIKGTKTLENLDYPQYGKEPNISQPKKFKI